MITSLFDVIYYFSDVMSFITSLIDFIITSLIDIIITSLIDFIITSLI